MIDGTVSALLTEFTNSPFGDADESRTPLTCAHADLLLPATTWGEKEGTVTNSERRITHVRAALQIGRAHV